MKNLIGLALLAAAVPAHAHHFMGGALPQTWLEGLLSGLGHPVIGLDHAAFIVAAGFLLARAPGGLWGAAALVLGVSRARRCISRKSGFRVSRRGSRFR